MKKQSLILLSGGLMMFAACNNQPANNAPSQAQIDSMANAKVEQMQSEAQAKNDSIIAAEAKAKADSTAIALKADSIAKAMNAKNKSNTVSKKASAPAHKSTTPAVPAPPPAASTTPQTLPSTGNQQQIKFNQRNTNNTNISDQKKEEQKNKFNNRGR